MVFLRATGKISQICHSLSHGTGRAISRSEASTQTDVTPYDFSIVEKKIYIPPKINRNNLPNERPECYRPLDKCVTQFTKTGIAVVTNVLSPFAYIGQY